MKIWKGLIAGAAALSLLTGQTAVTAQQAGLTGAQKDAMAQTLADADENQLLGVDETGWIYYQDSDWMTRKRYLDGTQDQPADGEKLLYFTPPGSYSLRDNRNMAVVRVTDDQPLLKQLYEHDFQDRFLFESGSSVVYWHGTGKERVSFGDEKIEQYTRGNVNVSNLDGSGNKTLFSDNGRLDYYSMSVHDGYVYYVLTHEDGYGGDLYRVGLDGKGRKKIAGDYADSVASNDGNVPGGLRYEALFGDKSGPVLAINGTVFYRSTDHGIYRIGADGKKTKLAGKGTAHYIVDGGWMYYNTEAVDEEGGLSYTGPIYRIKLGGGKPVKLTGIRANFVTAKDGWIYYEYDAVEGTGVLERKKADGSGLKQRIMSLEDHWFGTKLVGDWFVYSLGDDDDYRVKLDGSRNVAVKSFPPKCWPQGWPTNDPACG
ncbi:DUF5050 domain-containing protein [Paenibacillus sp. MWE-103]|uniref:DUF5050 domain-containing protein n=1 Tax=Paenibacillus artemisiicola TaxID=1172618 RepID=A0ABS3WIJ6_9BACL|nr:DUF5050 domain-containing protein [Paenibacillus artemisiicola]MBO7748122.1 DUF5050 domain-containing protein [Paenibacillus artemisiicola]